MGCLGVTSVILCMGAVWVGAGFIEVNWSQEEIQRSQEIGDGIIEAIDAYRQAHGGYPDGLDALVPDFIPEIPAPVAGLQVWEYRRIDDSPANPTFTLGFPSNSDGYPSCVYYPGSGWYVHEN